MICEGLPGCDCLCHEGRNVTCNCNDYTESTLRQQLAAANAELSDWRAKHERAQTELGEQDAELIVTKFHLEQANAELSAAKSRIDLLVERVLSYEAHYASTFANDLLKERDAARSRVERLEGALRQIAEKPYAAGCDIARAALEEK